MTTPTSPGERDLIALLEAEVKRLKQRNAALGSFIKATLEYKDQEIARLKQDIYQLQTNLTALNSREAASGTPSSLSPTQRTQSMPQLNEDDLFDLSPSLSSLPLLP